MGALAFTRAVLIPFCSLGIVAALIGGAAAQVARHLGARVIGADRHVPHPDAPIHAIAEKLIIGGNDLPRCMRRLMAKARMWSSIWLGASCSAAP